MITTEFLITAIIIVLVPGTGVIYTVSTGLTSDRRSGIAAAFGCTLGIVPHLCAATAGLSALLHLSARVFGILKFAGCIYLMYLAFSMWRSGDLVHNRGEKNKTGVVMTIIKGIMINLLNPKLTLFFFAFLPVFIKQNEISPLIQMIILGAVFMLMTFIVFAVYGVFAVFVGKRIGMSSGFIKKINRTFALLITMMAVKLSLSKQ